MSSPNAPVAVLEPSTFAPEVIIRVWDGVARLHYAKWILVKRWGER